MSSSDLQQTLFSLVTADKYFVEFIALPALPTTTSAMSNSNTYATSSSSAAASTTQHQLQRLTRVLGHAPPPLPQDHAFLSLIAHFDITRISNRLLACGLPWVQPSDKRAHRNNIHELAHFLNTRYGSNYMLWNLADDSALGQYDTSPFRNQVVTFSMSKAYQMSIKTLFDVCRSIHAWLALDTRNVALVHCTNGVGRTGVALACYMRFAKIFDDTVKAFDYFQKRRTPNDASWITKSQNRYVQYFNNVMILQGSPPNQYPLKLHSLILNGIPNFDGRGGCNPGIEIYEGGNLIYSCLIQPSTLTNQHQQLQQQQYYTSSNVINTNTPIYIDNNAIIFRILSTSSSDPLILSTDIQIRLFHCPDPFNNPTQVITMVNFSFHTGFMSSGLIRVAAKDLDLSRRDVEEGKFMEGFGMDLIFSDFKGEEQELDLRPLNYSKYLDRSMSKCLLRLVNHHVVKIDESVAQVLLKNPVFTKLMVCFALQNNNNDLQSALAFLDAQNSGDTHPIARLRMSRADLMMDRNLSNIGNERSASPLSFDSHSVVAASTTAEHNDVQASSGLGDQMSAASIIGPNIPRRTTLPNEMGVYTSNSQQQQRKPRSGLPADTQQYPSTHVPSFEPPQRPSSPAASSTFSSTSRDSASSTTLPPYIPQRKAVIRNSQRVYPRDSLITDPAATTTATIPSSLSLPLSIINNDSPVTPHAYYTPNTNSMEDASQQFNNNRPSHQQQQQIDTSTSSSERAHRDTVMSTISNSSTSSSISASMKRLEDLLAMPNRPTSLSRTGSLSNVSAAAAPGPSHSRSGSMTEVQPDPSVHHRQQQYQQPQHSGGFSRSSSDMAYEGGSHSATGLVPPHMTLPSQQHLRHASYEDSPLRNKMNVELEDVLEKLKARKAVEVGVGSSSNATSSPRVSTVLKDNIDELMSELKAAVISDDNEDDDVNSKLPSNGISSRGGGRADDDDEEEAYVTTGESRPVLAIVPLDNDPAPLLQPSSSSSTSATSSTANSDITSLYYIPPPANRAPPPPPPAALNQQQLQFSTSSSSSPSTPSATSPPPPPPSKPITERGLNADIKRFDEQIFVATKHGGLASGQLKRSKYTNLLTLRRSNNISIALSRFIRRGQSTRMLIHAVVGLEPGLFTIDDLYSVKAILPTPEERDMLSAYLQRKQRNPAEFANKPPLAPSETFLIESMKQRDLAHMLDVFIFSIQVEEEHDDMTSKSKSIQQVCHQIKSSDKFKLLLRFVYQLGSITNEQYAVNADGTTNASFKQWMGKDARSVGFKVDGLAKLKDVASADGKWSLMNFLVDFILRSKPEVVELPQEFKELRQVKEIDAGGLVERLMSLESTLTDLAPYRYVNADHVEIARPRLVKGGELLVQLRQTLFELEGTLSETTKYLGEDLAHYIPLMEPLRSTNPADLSTRNNTKQHMHVILALDTFMQAFDQMIAANRRQREEREQQVKRAERARQLSEKRKRGSVEEDEDEEDEEM